MRYLHTMVRVSNLEESLDFYCNKLGLTEFRRIDNDKGRFTLVFLCAPADLDRAADDQAPLVELTHNWDPENTKAGAISATSRIASTISTRPASA